ncbi:MAG TPA: Hsp20/alpha crystallin family protein [Dehalococcoidia bacterium]|nr:Hsp20/alpha crystallin family protein [Dehalococcoidia bacterium]
MTTRGPAFPDFGDLHDLLRFENRWPFAREFPRVFRSLERQSPAVDVFERDGRIVVKAEMPGIDPAKIEVAVIAGELRISGERHEEKEVKEEQYYRCERTFGRIHRTLTLPEGCDTEHIEARARNGVLEVVLPRKQPSGIRKVEVKQA